MAYIRKIKTGSGATAIQICYKDHQKVSKIVHVGSAKTREGVAKLRKIAKALLDKGKNPLFEVDEYTFDEDIEDIQMAAEESTKAKTSHAMGAPGKTPEKQGNAALFEMDEFEEGR